MGQKIICNGQNGSLKQQSFDFRLERCDVFFCSHLKRKGIPYPRSSVTACSFPVLRLSVHCLQHHGFHHALTQPHGEFKEIYRINPPSWNLEEGLLTIGGQRGGVGFTPPYEGAGPDTGLGRKYLKFG